MKWLRADKVGQGRGQGHGTQSGQDHGHPSMTDGQTEGLEIGRYANSNMFSAWGTLSSRALRLRYI